MTDVMIVGRGLAASVLMHTLHRHQVSFKVIGDPQLSQCSMVAAGIWNPVVFKRLTKSWLAEELVAELNTFYTDCENRLQRSLITQRPIIKPFTEDQEKKLWLKKAAGELVNFLDPELHDHIPDTLKGCIVTNGFGCVKQAGNLDVAGFLKATADHFNEHIVTETFDHAQLEVLEDKVIYGRIEARNVIFCEGHLVKHNPLFSWIPLKPAKGEVLTITTNELHLKDQVFNRNGFLMDVGHNTYRSGATYAWDDMSEAPTDAGLQELSDKLQQITPCSYAIVKHEAGIRPSSADRRPIIGRHPNYHNLYVFNGLGTKGVMLAPYFAKKFVYFYLQNQPLPGEVDVARFYHLYAGQKI